MVWNRALQHGQVFSVSAHLSTQSKQNLCVQPFIEATSDMQSGESRQMGQMKSGGGFSTTTAAIVAGFKSISLTESSSNSTIGDCIVLPRAAERGEGRRFSGDKSSMLPMLAAMSLSGFGFLLLIVAVVVTTGIPPLSLLIALSLTLNNDAERVELR